MVADKVTLRTRRAGTDEGVLWESTGEGTYSIGSLPPRTRRRAPR